MLSFRQLLATLHKCLKLIFQNKNNYQILNAAITSMSINTGAENNRKSYKEYN